MLSVVSRRLEEIQDQEVSLGEGAVHVHPFFHREHGGSLSFTVGVEAGTAPAITAVPALSVKEQGPSPERLR